MRWHVFGLVLTSILVLLGFSAFTTVRLAQAERRSSERQLEGATRSLSTAIDLQLREVERVLTALATSLPSSPQDLTAFYEQARKVAAQHDAAIVLTNAAAEPIFNTRVALGSALPPLNAAEQIREAIATGQPQVTNLYRGTVAERPLFSVFVPVRGGETLYALGMAFPAEAISTAAALQRLPGDWIAVIADRNGIILGRSRAAGDYVGKPVSSALRENISRADEGHHVGVTLEGIDVYNFFTRSRASGWTVAIGVPVAVADAPLWASVKTLAAGGAVFLALGVAASFGFSRRLSRAVRSIAVAATALGRREDIPHFTSRIKEVIEIGAALSNAAETLKDSEGRLLEQQASFRLLFENNPLPMWVHDRETLRFLAVNTAALNHYGYTHEEFMRMSLLDLSSGEEIPSPGAEDQAAASGPETIWRHRKSDGAEIEIAVYSCSLRYMDSQASLVAAVDVTARKQADERLRQATETLSAVIDASPVAIICVAADRRVLVWSRAAEQIFGYTAEECVGQPYKLVPPGGEAEFDELFTRALGGEPMRHVEVSRRRKDGTLLDVSFAGGTMYDADGKARGVAYALEDITEKKRAANELRAAEAQLRQAQKMEAIGQLTGGLSHDFNNLLGVVIGNLDYLKEHVALDPDASEAVDECLDAALRGAELNRRLLAFARRQPLQPKRLDVNELVASTSKLLSRTLGGQVEIRLALEAGVGPIVADPAQLESALTNLAVNARDAMPRGGCLTVTTYNKSIDEVASEQSDVTPGEYAVIEVTDTGVGIAPDVLKRVFEPFFTTKEVGQGTGLGLSMVFGFMKQSEGHARIYSEPGTGTTVRLYFPRVQESSRAGEMAAELTSLPRAHGSEVVLVVEDDQRLRRILVKQLKELGYQVLEADAGRPALELIRGGGEIGLLLTDIVMPGGMSGYELAREAATIRPKLKVLFTSGFPQAAFGPDMKPLEGEALLSKPYRKEELAHKIRQVLAA